MKALSFVALALGLSAAGADAQITQVAYGSLSGTQTVTFDDGPGNTNYNSVFFSNGVGFAERFVGQTRTSSGGFDVLGGNPSGPLALQIGATGENLYVLSFGTNVLTGLGPITSLDNTGEGSFAALFSSDQSQFGFQLVGGDGGSATIGFYRGNGSLIQSIVVSNLANAFYGFQRDGAVKDIRGISIFNNDPGGIGFDNLRFDVPSVQPNGVPEPATWGMMLLGFGAIGFAKRRTKVGTRVRFA